MLWFIIGLFRGHHTTTHKFDFAGLSDAKKLEIFVMEEEYELWHWIDERVGKSQRTPGRFFVPFEGANPKMVDFSKSKTAAAGGGDNAEDMTQADLEEAIRDSKPISSSCVISRQACCRIAIRTMNISMTVL